MIEERKGAAQTSLNAGSVRSKMVCSVLSVAAGTLPPAAFTRMSIRPHRSNMVRLAASSSSFFNTSAICQDESGYEQVRIDSKQTRAISQGTLTHAGTTSETDTKIEERWNSMSYKYVKRSITTNIASLPLRMMSVTTSCALCCFLPSTAT